MLVWLEETHRWVIDTLIGIVVLLIGFFVGDLMQRVKRIESNEIPSIRLALSDNLTDVRKEVSDLERERSQRENELNVTIGRILQKLEDMDKYIRKNGSA